MLVLRNPATTETYGFVDRAADTNGEVFRLEWSAQPGGRVAEHVHPHQKERFDVTSGELTVVVDGAASTVGSGESTTVPRGMRHWFENRGVAPVTAILEVRPALRIEEVFESLARMAQEGRCRDDGLPRNLLLRAVFAHEYRREIRGPRPPYALQRLLLPPLAALGRRLGYRVA